MALIDKLLGQLIREGELTLVFPDGKERTFGPGGGRAIRVRLNDRRVAFDVARNPRLGIGEAYMDGRITIENGSILDLVELVVGANRWEDKGGGRKALNKGKKRWKALFRRNWMSCSASGQSGVWSSNARDNSTNTSFGRFSEFASLKAISA